MARKYRRGSGICPAKNPAMVETLPPDTDLLAASVMCAELEDPGASRGARFRRLKAQAARFLLVSCESTKSPLPPTPETKKNCFCLQTTKEESPPSPTIAADNMMLENKKNFFAASHHDHFLFLYRPLLPHKTGASSDRSRPVPWVLVRRPRSPESDGGVLACDLS